MICFIAENYLLAFGENDRKAEFFQLLKVLDIRKISSPKYIASIFKFLGRWKLDNFSEKFIFALKAAGIACGFLLRYLGFSESKKFCI